MTEEQVTAVKQELLHSIANGMGVDDAFAVGVINFSVEDTGPDS